MKKIIFLLALLPMASFGQVHYHITTSTMVIWSIGSDTLTQGDSSYINVKYGYYLGGNPSDSVYVQLFPEDVAISKKIAVDDLVNYPANADGTTTIKIKIPANATLGNSTIYLGSGTVSLYVRSKLPDISITQLGNTNDTTGQEFSLKIAYTFLPTPFDTLKIFIGDSLVYKGSYTKSLISFHVPYFNSSNTYQLTIIDWPGSEGMNITKPSHVVSGLFDPIANSKIETHYYNMQGEEIQKPTDGFYIWKSLISSGKVYINPLY